MPLKKTYGKIAFLSTFPPRECGLATFTQDLINAMDHNGSMETGVIAVNNSEKHQYDRKVIAEIRQNEKRDYYKIAYDLNHSDIDLLVIEHEYGIFGGEYGEYVLDLVYNLKIPIVTTLHTILPDPDKKHKHIIETLGQMSEKMVTMAANTKEILENVYGVDPEKIEVIHHGVPKRLFESRDALKEKYGYKNKQVVSTFGLLGPGKGIEYGIEAIAEVAKEHKDIEYLILGQTHPSLKEEGVSYRRMLEALVEKHGLSDNVKFINKYLSKDEIIQYLQMSDIYMTPYLAKNQAVSGTMAYAVGYGKAIVSTPYLYAQEMLANGRGILAKFADSGSLADSINEVLGNPDRKARMERDTIKIGRTMYWDKVAQSYIDVFSKIIRSIPEIKVV